MGDLIMIGLVAMLIINIKLINLFSQLSLIGIFTEMHHSHIIGELAMSMEYFSLSQLVLRTSLMILLKVVFGVVMKLIIYYNCQCLQGLLYFRWDLQDAIGTGKYIINGLQIV